MRADLALSLLGKATLGPEVMNQIAVVNQGGKASAERVIVLPGEEFDALIGRPGYHQRDNGDLERREGSL